MDIEINYLAVLAAAVASMVVGSVWYGPLFGKKFSSVMGFDKLSPEQQAEAKKGMALTYLWQFVASMLMFYVFAWVVAATKQLTLAGGLTAAFWVWLGFVVPVKFGDALWGGKMVLFWLGIGNLLVTLLAAGAIIGAWH